MRAKTGTLRGVSALSGYVVDPNERVIAFSILAQGFSGRTSSIWKVQNAIGEALATDGNSWIASHPERFPRPSLPQGTKLKSEVKGQVR